MPELYKWIETTGGPHLLLPEELLDRWRGIDGWHDHSHPSDKSDYARACRVQGRLGVIRCHTGKALVLSGEVGPVAWIADADQCGGILVQWLGVDDEASIGKVLGGQEIANALASPSVDEVGFPTGPSGALRLFDSSESGNNLQSESELLRLLPGTYRVRAAHFESNSLMIVVRKISQIKPLIRS